MKVQDLKELIAQLDDEAEVLVTSPEGFRSATGYLSHAVCLRRSPEPEEVAKGIMAMADRVFVCISLHSHLTPDWLKEHAENVLVIAA